MSHTSIEKLAEFGQSAWLDNINRSMIDTGGLKNMIGLGLKGMTSNPAIFDKAIRLSGDYDEKTKELCALGKNTFEIYDDLTVRDVQDASDIFADVYKKTDGLDGYVSLEVDPRLAFNAEETKKEALRLFKKVKRPNVMFKVPATGAGFKAVEGLVSEGLNINVTLIFSLGQYINTAKAFLRGLEILDKKGEDLKKVNSVASVFVSRIDTYIDSALDRKIAAEKDCDRKEALNRLKGKAAIANSKIIFNNYIEIFSGSMFKSLALKGARPQRVLWASTSTKNPAYSDIKYVTELIAKDTVNTMPEDTLKAFLGHGSVKDALTSGADYARKIIMDLKNFGIDVDMVCAELLKGGIVAFEKSFQSLLGSIEAKREILC